MVFQRIWGFMARHKRKFISTGALVGGGYAVYKWYLPKLQERLLKKALQMVGDDGTLKTLLELAGGGDNKKAKFAHKQNVSDNVVIAFVVHGASVEARSLLSDEHNTHFRITEMSRDASQGTDQTEKMRALQNLTSEIIARALSSVLVLCSLLMVHRVEINILGRQMNEDGGNDAAKIPGFAAFIETGKYVAGGGLGRIADVARASAQQMMAQSELTPRSKVSASELKQHLSNACAHASAELFAGRQCVETLLPESIEIAGPAKGQADALLNETRDMLESPQFLEVFRSVFATVMGQVVGDLASNGKGGSGPFAREGASVPLGKLLGRLTEISNAILSAETGLENNYITSAIDVPELQELCESLYFHDGSI